MYWNIKKILPYQRNFNFINSIRSTGKSYTTCGFFIERFLKQKEEFMLVVRTQNEKTDNALGDWVKKVMIKEYPDVPYLCTKDKMFYTPDKKDKNTWEVMGHCKALSEAVKIKKKAFPGVRWMCMEEYMLEPKNQDEYVKGWKEPDLFLSLYHTIDREEDYVVCFLLGNNTAFYNPYHLHKAFNIPPVEPGRIWTGKNVLFQWALPSEELKRKKNECKFLDMIGGTEYGKYAKEGEYIGDNYNFVGDKSNKAIYCFSFKTELGAFGVWHDYDSSFVYISYKQNAINGICISIDRVDSEGDVLGGKSNSLIKWLGNKYKKGLVFYEDMEIKLKVENTIRRFC